MVLDVDTLVNEAVQHARPKLAGAARALPAGVTVEGVARGGKVELCKIWPTVKVGLEILKDVLPSWAGLVAGIIIKIGDKLCP